jgi:enamine deaminase RidA (YjgF/YER057c/UK114 family)
MLGGGRGTGLQRQQQTAAQQLTDLLEQVDADMLSSCGLVLGHHAYYVYLYLSDLAEDYGAVNAAYAEFFSARSGPPTRVAVGMALAELGAAHGQQQQQEAKVAVEVYAHSFSGAVPDEEQRCRRLEQCRRPPSSSPICASASSHRAFEVGENDDDDDDDDDDDGVEAGCAKLFRGGLSKRSWLHVQSMSCWAPANIGPYSQASEVGGVVRLAGMIALQPDTMQLAPHGEGLLSQASTCLRHCGAVLESMKSELALGVGVTAFLVPSSGTISEAEQAVRVEALEAVIRDAVHPHAVLTVVHVLSLPRGAEVEIQIDALVATGSGSNGFGSGGSGGVGVWKAAALPASVAKTGQCSSACDGRVAFAALQSVDLSSTHLQDAVGLVRAVVETAVGSVAPMCAASPIAVVRVYCPANCYSNALKLASRFMEKGAAGNAAEHATVIASVLPSSSVHADSAVVQVHVW